MYNIIRSLLKVLTVNGALVKKRDLGAKNGVVHVVDRVLFPPTVGDLVQTLQVRNAMINCFLTDEIS